MINSLKLIQVNYNLRFDFGSSFLGLTYCSLRVCDLLKLTVVLEDEVLEICLFRLLDLFLVLIIMMKNKLSQKRIEILKKNVLFVYDYIPRFFIIIIIVITIWYGLGLWSVFWNDFMKIEMLNIQKYFFFFFLIFFLTFNYFFLIKTN